MLLEEIPHCQDGKARVRHSVACAKFLSQGVQGPEGNASKLCPTLASKLCPTLASTSRQRPG